MWEDQQEPAFWKAEGRKCPRPSRLPLVGAAIYGLFVLAGVFAVIAALRVVALAASGVPKAVIALNSAGVAPTARYNRSKRVKITISKENYLKAIAEAESEGETVKAATLSRWLNVTAPAVTMAIKRLKRDALIRVGEEGHITLTVAGREIANRILNRHHLIERMLTEIFGMEWYKVHEEAEQLEHAVSSDFERKLVEKLGAGEACPHGNRVGVDTPADRRRRGLKTLDESAAKEAVAVTSVYERDRRLLEYLEGLGVRPGSMVSVESRNADDTLTLHLDGRCVQLGRSAAQKVWVKAA